MPLQRALTKGAYMAPNLNSEVKRPFDLHAAKVPLLHKFMKRMRSGDAT